MDLSPLVPELRLAQPLWLIGLALLPGWLLWVGARQRASSGWPWPALVHLGPLPRSPRQRLLWLPGALRLVVLVLLLLALARPQVGRTHETTTQHGVDIMLAVDVSLSMLARDIQPNRIEAAKAAVRAFLAETKTDRLGLVVFTGRAFTLCPLTSDHAVVAELLERTRVHMISAPSTAVGDALGTCLNRLQPAPGEDETATPRSRVVILLTDGESNAGAITPREAALAAARMGVRVHCVGVGSAAGAPVPVTGWSGQEEFMQNDDYSLYIARMEERELREVADLTGGQYYRATDAGALARIYQQIAAMEQSAIEVQRVTRHEERFPLLALLALCLLLVELGLRATWLRVEQ